MDIQLYQTIPELGLKGRMDTPAEFDRIQLPKDLKGWSVLDIGCNTGAFLLEAWKRGATKLTGVEPNQQWRYLAHGVLTETVTKAEEKIIYKLHPELDPYIEQHDLVFLLSVTHLKDGRVIGQDLFDYAWDLTKKLLIVEVNDRLQERPILMPRDAKFIGKNKDNRSVYHCYRKEEKKPTNGKAK